ncbi:MAG: hypothetical protein U5K37_09940 [Natrialbaceae archaeon]|nr:hypothetical protein [Natrialbaceae archaeon]
MTGSSLAFSVLFLVGLAGSVAVMGHAATHWRGRGQMALVAGRRIHLAWLYLLVPLALFAGLVAIRPGSAIAELVELYARGIAVDQGRGLGPGLWMVVWLGVVLGPVTAGVVHVTMEYPERTDLYYGTALVYLATLAVLFLWGLSYRTVGVPLAFGDADRALVFRYGAPAVFMLPYGVCAYTVGRALYYRDGRLLTWTLLAWAVVILQALFYMWYALERFLGGGPWG